MSLRIVHTFGHQAGVVTTIDKDVVRFGRAPGNDVVFDPDYDRDASGEHAEIRKEGGAWVLVDRGSRNGTFVGPDRVERRPLRSGDEVTFGKKGPRIRIEFGSPGKDMPTGARPAGQDGPTGTVAMSATATPHAAKLGAPPAPPAPPAPAPGPSPMGSRAAPSPFLAGSPAPANAGPRAAQPVPAPQAGRRVGQKTIAQLISSAVAVARGSGGQKMNTQALNQYVDRQVGAATAGQRRTTIFLAVMLFVAIAGLGGLVIWSQWSSDEIDRLRHDLAGLSPTDPRRKEIEGRLGTLHPANASFGRNLYDQNKKGIFMLAAGGQGFCTAFAIRPNVLATNAHCVIAARQHGGSIVALENEGHGDVSFPVADMRAHPSYRASDPNVLTPDVGIAMLSGRTAVVLTMASNTELAAVGAGDDVYLIGFPGRLMDTSNPAATFLGAHVGRVTTAGGRPGGFADTWLVQHDAPTTHGTSGSPIFNGKGHVIGINSGGYLEGDEETVSGRKTEVVRASPYKFGMRIDLINALLR